jgi:acyl carrier protein
MEAKESVGKFVNEQFLKGNKAITITDDSSFIDEGIIDSLGVLELVSFIEETFGFRVEDEEMVPDNLDSINKIVAYVSLKLAAVKA